MILSEVNVKSKLPIPKVIISNRLKNIEVEYKYCACLHKYKNLKVKIWRETKNIGTEFSYLYYHKA